MYDVIDEVIKNFPDEEWHTANKLRNAANDSLFYASLAIGNSEAEASKYDYNAARKNLFALQAMYIFATKQKFTKLDPEIVVLLDDILAKVDKRIEASEKRSKEKEKAELEPWLEKYRLWQKMNP